MAVQWDGSRAALRAILETMRDCFVSASDYDGVLYVKTAEAIEHPVPLGWYVSRAADGRAVITEEEPVD